VAIAAVAEHDECGACYDSAIAAAGEYLPEYNRFVGSIEDEADDVVEEPHGVIELVADVSNVTAGLELVQDDNHEHNSRHQGGLDMLKGLVLHDGVNALVGGLLTSSQLVAAVGAP